MVFYQCAQFSGSMLPPLEKVLTNFETPKVWPRNHGPNSTGEKRLTHQMLFALSCFRLFDASPFSYKIT